MLSSFGWENCVIRFFSSFHHHIVAVVVVWAINWILPVGLSLMIIQYNGHSSNKLISLAKRIKKISCTESDCWLSWLYSDTMLSILFWWLLIKIFRFGSRSLALARPFSTCTPTWSACCATKCTFHLIHSIHSKWDFLSLIRITRHNYIVSHLNISAGARTDILLIVKSLSSQNLNGAGFIANQLNLYVVVVKLAILILWHILWSSKNQSKYL